jgi:hypothetical protein
MTMSPSWEIMFSLGHIASSELQQNPDLNGGMLVIELSFLNGGMLVME